ncbi:P2Y purinoceptor 2-like [Oncorhynchus clarkii lewisi]|uniref:P2Y purinoceptor 2-like n=1 Tax=Oncorhynchus clarkii lewisi TaxID=490388 RepID=UPI0039B90B54
MTSTESHSMSLQSLTTIPANINADITTIQANSSNTELCTVESQHGSIPVILILVFVVGFLLNSFSLWVFCLRIPHWSSGTTLQFNLALSDALGTPATPLMAVYLTNGSNWTFGPLLCVFKIVLLSAHFLGSILFLMLISIHHYVVVVKFNKSSHMKQNGFVRKLCGGVWLLLLVEALVLTYFLPPSKEGDKTQCLTIHQHDLTDVYFVINFFLLILGFLLPFSVAAESYRRLANSVSQLNINSARGLSVKIKSQRMIGICLVIFGLCFLPLNLVRTIGVVVNKYSEACTMLRHLDTAYYVSFILAGVNSCLDPLLYCFGSQTFRKAFQGGSFSVGRMNTQRSTTEL